MPSWQRHQCASCTNARSNTLLASWPTCPLTHSIPSHSTMADTTTAATTAAAGEGGGARTAHHQPHSPSPRQRRRKRPHPWSQRQALLAASALCTAFATGYQAVALAGWLQYFLLLRYLETGPRRLRLWAAVWLVHTLGWTLAMSGSFNDPSFTTSGLVSVFVIALVVSALETVAAAVYIVIGTRYPKRVHAKALAFPIMLTAVWFFWRSVPPTHPPTHPSFPYKSSTSFQPPSSPPPTHSPIHSFIHPSINPFIHPPTHPQNKNTVSSPPQGRTATQLWLIGLSHP